MTHTFTITPIITAEGFLLNPLHVVLQEVGGKFGPQVKANMFSHEMLHVTCSKSGKVCQKI